MDLDLKELRRVAERLVPFPNTTAEDIIAFLNAFDPLTILALLDRLEAAEYCYIAEVQQQNRAALAKGGAD